MAYLYQLGAYPTLKILRHHCTVSYSSRHIFRVVIGTVPEKVLNAKLFKLFQSIPGCAQERYFIVLIFVCRSPLILTTASFT
jgi:hypothetical protein